MKNGGTSEARLLKEFRDTIIFWLSNREQTCFFQDWQWADSNHENTVLDPICLQMCVYIYDYMIYCYLSFSGIHRFVQTVPIHMAWVYHQKEKSIFRFPAKVHLELRAEITCPFKEQAGG